MIIRIHHPAQLAKGPILQDLFGPRGCVERYCAKANDGATPDDLKRILRERVFPGQNGVATAWLFLGLDERVRVQAFAFLRPLQEYGRPVDTIQFWHVYVAPNAPPGLMEEGFQTIRDFFKEAGITRFQFCSARNVDGRAWERLLKDMGFKAVATIYELNATEGSGEHGFSEDRPGSGGPGNPKTGTMD